MRLVHVFPRNENQIIRGLLCTGSNRESQASYMGKSFRHPLAANTRHITIGFRLLRTAR